MNFLSILLNIGILYLYLTNKRSIYIKTQIYRKKKGLDINFTNILLYIILQFFALNNLYTMS